MMETFSWLLMKSPIRDDGRRFTSIKQRHMALRHKKQTAGFSSVPDDLAREPEAQTLVEEAVRTKERNQIPHLCMDELNPDYRRLLSDLF